MRNDMTDKTIEFKIPDNRDSSVKETLTAVYKALKEKGYNPINQMVGYILSEDPTYITTHNNARNMIRKIDREEMVDSLTRHLRDKGLSPEDRKDILMRIQELMK